MDNIKIRCRSCGRELEGHHNKTVSCGCPNMATIRGDKISALDLSNIVMLNSYHPKIKKESCRNKILSGKNKDDNAKFVSWTLRFDEQGESIR